MRCFSFRGVRTLKASTSERKVICVIHCHDSTTMEGERNAGSEKRHHRLKKISVWSKDGSLKIIFVTRIPSILGCKDVQLLKLIKGSLIIKY